MSIFSLVKGEKRTRSVRNANVVFENPESFLKRFRKYQEAIC